VDEARAEALLSAERGRVEQLLRSLDDAQQREFVAERETGDYADAAQPLTAEGVDDAVISSLRDRLRAIERAERRLYEGVFGQSVRSGLPISDDRLEADPTAELTIEEADAKE
jgi:DnaK suppressor protein